MTDSSSMIVRRNGFWETLNMIASRRWLGMGTMVAMAQGTGPMTEALVREAAAMVFRRHRVLRCRLTEDPVLTSFVDDVRIEDIPVFTRQVSGEAGVIEAFEQLLHEEIPDQRRLWGVLYAPEPDDSTWRIFIKTHHCIADGRSIASMLDQFVEACSALVQDRAVNWPEFDVPPPAEARVREPMTAAEAAAVAEQAQDLPMSRWPLDHEAPNLGSRRCRLTFRSFDQDTTARLRARSHEHGVSIMSVLAAAGALTQARRLNQTVDTDHLTPVDMRRFFETPPDPGEITMAAYVVRVLMPQVAPDADPWLIARQYHQAQDAVVVRTSIPPFDFEQEDVTGGMDCWSDADGAYRHGFCFSNVGPLNRSCDHGPFVTDRVEMTAEAHMGGVPMLMPVLTHKGVMRVCFTWTEPLMDDDEAIHWIDGICAVLDQAAGS